VAPFALTGSAYTKTGGVEDVTGDASPEQLEAIRTQELWNSTASLLMIASGAFSLVLAVVIGWAIQNTLDEHYAELTTPLPEHVDLHWLDYKQAEIRARSDIVWTDVPRAMRVVVWAAVVLEIMTCQTTYWMFSTLFGKFKVSDDPEDLVWCGEPPDALISLAAILCLGAYVFACLLWISFQKWRSVKTQSSRLAATAALMRMEASWKENWLRQLEDTSSKNLEKKRTNMALIEHMQSRMLDSESVGGNGNATRGMAYEGRNRKDDAEDVDSPLVLVTQASAPCATLGTTLVGKTSASAYELESVSPTR